MDRGYDSVFGVGGLNVEFELLGLGFGDSGIGFRVWRLLFRVSGFAFRVSCFGARCSGFVFRVSCFVIRDLGLMFRVSGLGSQVSGFGYQSRNLLRHLLVLAGRVDILRDVVEFALITAFED